MRKIFFVLVTTLVFTVSGYTQSESEIKQMFNSAESLEAVDDYVGAEFIFEKLVAADPENANFNFRLANAIVQSKSHKDPLPYLEVAVKGVDPKKYRANYKTRFAPDLTWFLIAKEYHRSMQFSKAIVAYNTSLAFVNERNTPLRDELTGYIANCKSGLELEKQPVKVKHVDFPPVQLFPRYVHSPLFSPDESVFIFTVTDKSKDEITGDELEGDYDENIYSMQFRNGRWSKPSLLSSDINSSRKEASIGISPDGQTLLVYRDDFGDGNIYYSELSSIGEWGKPKKFPASINTSSQESHATLSADGKTLYFSSDRKGGYGGMDLYISTKDSKGHWTKAENLGPQINTKWHEESPHLQAYSNILYFCSNRPESIGGFDVFRCELLPDNTVTNLVNLGYPINTPYNDIFFKTTADGKKGYFSSNCKSSYGELDLNMVEFLDMKLFPNVTVKGIVIDQQGDTLRNSLVSLFDIDAKDITDSALTSIRDGVFTFHLNSENKYFASFHHKGWVYFSKPFHIEKYFANNTFSNLITLDPIILDDSSMRQSLNDFVIMKNDLRRRKNGEDVDDEKTISDELFADIVKQKSISFTKSKTNMNPLARPSLDVEMIAGIKGPQSVLPEISTRIVDLDMPLTNLMIPNANLDDDEYLLTKAKADSLKSVGIENFKIADYVLSIEQFEQALNLYEELGLIDDVIFTANYLAKALTISGRIDEAIPPHLLALSLLRQLDNKKAISDKEYEIGIAYDQLYNKINAVSYLSQSRQGNVELANLDGQIQAVSAMVDVYRRHSDYPNMIKMLDELLLLTQQKGDKGEIASVLNDLGLAYNEMSDYDKAMNYFNQSILESEGLGDKKALSIYLNNIGNTLFAQGEYESALDYYQRSLDIKREIKYLSGEALTLHNMGNTHYRMDELDPALHLLTASMALSDQLNDTRLIAQNHFSLMQVNQSLGRFLPALEHYENFIALRIPNFGKRKEQVALKKNKYELKQSDIALLKQKMQKQELFVRLEAKKRDQELSLLEQKKRRANQFFYGIISGVGGVFILLLLLAGRLKSKQKLNKKLIATQQIVLSQKDQILAQKTELETINTQLEKLSIVASETVNAVAIFDGNGNFEWVNQGFVDIYGKRSADLNTKERMSIYNIHNDQVSKDFITTALDEKIAVSFEAIKHVRSGAHIWMNSSVTPIYSEGELLKIIVIDSDVNDLKEKEREIGLQRDEIAKQRDEIEKQRDIAVAQKEEIEAQAEQLQSTINDLQSTQKKLIEAEKMASLGNLVAGVAHEINTPVGIGIAAASSFKTKTHSLNELFTTKKMKQTDLMNYLKSAKEATNLLKVNLNRTGELVKSFKQVSVDEITEQCRSFDFRDYLKDVLNSLEPKLNEKVVEIDIQVEQGIVLTSYPGAFAQILTNFVVNSLMHGFLNREGGAITIKGRTDGDMFAFDFIDDGAGMTADTMKKCFDPFFTTNMQLGTGLGLNIVYNLVSQKLHGEVSCSSEYGSGACFTVKVPVNVQAQV